ncbi:MAG: pyruvate kinase [Alphaproteobacteria bacterium]
MEISTGKNKMKHDSFVKIVATLGPSSSSYEMIKKLAVKGADVFRLNFSHGSPDEHRKTYDNIRKVEKEVGRPVGVIADLQGPKLRVGKFKDGEVTLEKGQNFRLDLNSIEGNEKGVCLPHPEIFAALKVGANLLLNDGRIRLQVESYGSDFAETRVIDGGVLSDRKGVNVPDVELPISALTEKDIKDLKFALEMGADWIALSFVQKPEDIQRAREIINGRAGIIAKLEKPNAIEYLEKIVMFSDAVMVARGDLGVECPPEIVPLLQKRIINFCRQAAKPVIVATQMLESMIYAPTPTRAEASDVATAVYDGADAVMLSAETASGKFPENAVSIMNRIINSVENDDMYQVFMDTSRPPPKNTDADAITAAACQVARSMPNTAAIVNYTMSGSTTLRTARRRPGLPILCLTPSEQVARKMALVWGVTSHIAKAIEDFPDIERKAVKHCLECNIAAKGQSVIITAGVPFGIAGTTNILRISTIQ